MNSLPQNALHAGAGHAQDHYVKRQTTDHAVADDAGWQGLRDPEGEAQAGFDQTELQGHSDLEEEDVPRAWHIPPQYCHRHQFHIEGHDVDDQPPLEEPHPSLSQSHLPDRTEEYPTDTEDV
ncbi:hypothetical protein C0995_008425 [Termitomyces sp. Mi166|nr:hypothetical protein C0995_008425 [Termitomyces sp. Mi166\